MRRSAPLAASRDQQAAGTLNGITLKATPEQAVEFVRAADRGELDETAMAARLVEFSGT